jgi:kynurenine formamidase
MVRPGQGETVKREQAHSQQPTLSAAEFRALYRRLAAIPGRGPADRRGALNNITASEVLAAAGEVRSGRTVSLARPIEDAPSPDNPEPFQHQMTGHAADRIRVPGMEFAADRFTMNVHGDADSHIDALCHVIYDDKLYNDVSVETLTPTGASALSIDVAHDGIVGRGVLLDIPRVRAISWLEPGDQVTLDDLVAAERDQNLRVGRGDLLFVRVGHSRRRTEVGPWNAADARAGLDPAAMEFVADRQVAVLGSDGNSDTAPSTTEGVAFPVHVLAINALGLHLLDYLRFEDLAPLCEETKRWTFFCVIAPLRLPLATGSPVNPIAIL